MKINVANALNDIDADHFAPASHTVAVLVSTQYMENYGAHDWDGRGECPQYWKPKGGSEYLVTGVPAHLGAQEVIARMSDSFEHRSDYSHEYVIGADVVGEDYDPAVGEVDPTWAEFLRSGLIRLTFPN